MSKPSSSGQTRGGRGNASSGQVQGASPGTKSRSGQANAGGAQTDPLEQRQRVAKKLRESEGRPRVKVNVIIHEAEEGGYWAEVPALPGCFSQGETVDETLANVREAIEGVLSSGAKHLTLGKGDQVREIQL